MPGVAIKQRNESEVNRDAENLRGRKDAHGEKGRRKCNRQRKIHIQLAGTLPVKYMEINLDHCISWPMTVQKRRRIKFKLQKNPSPC